MKHWINFDNFIKSLALFLLLNLFILLIWNSWFVKEIQNLNLIFISRTFLWGYFIFIVFCFAWLAKERITMISLSLSGFKAELKQIQQERENSKALREELRKLALEMLESQVTLIENAKRWSGWSKNRSDEALEKIKGSCSALNCDDKELKKVFQTKLFWDKIDNIDKVKDLVISHITDPSSKNLIHSEWESCVKTQQKPSGLWLRKHVENLNINQNEKDELLASIDSL